jgi:predicted alpha/beta-fold hydrolase
VRFVVTQNGGHVGFVATRALTPVYWGEKLVVDFLASRAAVRPRPLA